MATPSPLYQSIKATTEAYIASIDAASRLRSVSHVSSTLTPDCLRYFAPKSWAKVLTGLQRPFTNEQYEESIKLQIEEAFDSLHQVVDLVVDEVQRKSVVHVETYLFERGERKTGAELRVGQERFMVEFVLTLSMDAEGKKIQKVMQFIDALGVKAVMDGHEAVEKKIKDVVG